jgi:hypothetical protein
MANSKSNVDKKKPGALNTISPAHIEYVNGPQYSAFYSNNIGFAVNVLDFVLMFGEILEANPEKALVERRARVTLNPIQAKVLTMLLIKNIQTYESLNGTIKIPEGAVDTASLKP